MELTASQADLLRCLRLATQAERGLRVVYCTEWLGYLPFGLYHWIEADGQDISTALPLGWSGEDLKALETVGLLLKVDERRNPSDELETKITYEVTLH
jgi:hypothetical protein